MKSGSHEKDSGAPKACSNCWLLAAMVLAAALAFGLFGDKTESRAAALAPHCTKWPLGALSLPKHFAVGLKTPSLEHSLASRSRSHEPQFGDALFSLLCALITAIGSRKSLMRWPLFALCLAALLPLATALNCEIDLSLFANYETVHCDAGCDSCKFVKNSGGFAYGTLKCSTNVPCAVEVYSDLYRPTINGSMASVLSVKVYSKMDYSTIIAPLNSALSVELLGSNADVSHSKVNGSLASALSVKVDSGYYPFSYTYFYAPVGGNFNFEATNTQTAVSRTRFHAENSKVVDIAIYDDHVDDAEWPEMSSLSVYASNADELRIYLGPNTRYATVYDSLIECPSSGLCQWTSFGKRYYYNVDYMKPVSVNAFPTTDLRVLCDNNEEACDKVTVDCQTSTCDMQYSMSSNTWVCYSTCTNFDIETITMTTTLTPNSGSKSQSNDSSLVVGLVLTALAVFCLAAAFYYYKHYYAKALADAVHYGVSDIQAVDEKSEESDNDTEAKEFVDWFHATFEEQSHKYLKPLLANGYDCIEELALMETHDVNSMSDKIPRGHCKRLIREAVVQQSTGYSSPARHHTADASE